MKNKLSKWMAMTAIVGALWVGVQAAPAPKIERQAQEKKSMLRHVVLFKFKPETTPAKIKEVEDAFRALPTKIDTIIDFEWGTNVSPENLSQGFTHCFFVSFANEADRDAYLPHPAHKEFGQMLGDSLDKALVVDYLSQK